MEAFKPKRPRSEIQPHSLPEISGDTLLWFESGSEKSCIHKSYESLLDSIPERRRNFKSGESGDSEAAHVNAPMGTK